MHAWYLLVFSTALKNPFKHFSIREKRDVDALEEDPDTKQLFLEQGTWESKQEKEMQEYLDALNKQVIDLGPIFYKRFEFLVSGWANQPTLKMGLKARFWRCKGPTMSQGWSKKVLEKPWLL